MHSLNSLAETKVGVPKEHFGEQLTSQDSIEHLNLVQGVQSLYLRERILEALYDARDLLPTLQKLTNSEIFGL